MTYTDQEKTTIITSTKKASPSKNSVQNTEFVGERFTAGQRYIAQQFQM